MLADLYLLLIAVFCTADDLLPESARNARRSVTDAEVVTLAVAQEMLGIDHDAEFLPLAQRPPRPPVPEAADAARLLEAPATTVGHDRVADRCLRGREPRFSRQRGVAGLHPSGVRTVDRDRPAVAARRACGYGYGYGRSHSRWFWGIRLHLLATPDGTRLRRSSLPPTKKNVRLP
jgi:hypothetical protein